MPAAPFTSSADAIGHFVSTTCCVGIARRDTGDFDRYAPFGLRDLYEQRVRPNAILAPKSVYDAKSARWLSERVAKTDHRAGVAAQSSSLPNPSAS